MEIFRSRNVKSAVYGTLIVVTSVVFIWGWGSGMGGRGGNKNVSLREECVVTVKGQCVTPRDFNGARRMFIRRLGGDSDRAAAMGLNRIIVDGLIERELLISDASRLGLTVTETELNDQLFEGILRVSLPTDKESLAYQFRIDGGRVFESFRDPKTKKFDMKYYERSVRLIAGRSPTDFREAQSRELLAAKMRDLIRAPVRVSDVEALDAYVGEKSSGVITYVSVPQKFAARYGVAVTDAEIDKWAAEEANKKLIDSMVTSRKEADVPKPKTIRHILVKVDPSATTEAKALALGRISEAAARIKRGEPFGEVAREYSEDPGSAQKGGAYPEEMLAKFVEPFKNAAMGLKPGEMTPGAVETNFGYHLIAKDDPGQAAAVEAALPKAIARELYIQTKANEAAKEIGDKIFAAMKAGKSAEEAAKAGLVGLKNPNGPKDFVPLPVFKPAAPPAAADAGGAAVAEAGATASADAGASTTSVTSADAGAAPAAPVIVAKATTAENDPDRPQAQTSGSFNRGGGDIPGLTGETAAKVINWVFTAKPGDLYSELVRGDDNYVAVGVKERKAATREEYEKERDTYITTLLAAKQNEALALYVKRLREAAKSDIKINESYLKEAVRDGGAGSMPMPEDEE